ncbi:hypothetical protein [Bradyrhizobium sp. ARR65]|uniref:hypothetical protein n=1 Tax=Bradyrhizobium sp. ARR65 TaxID=1040989 RepID=UPI000463CA5F|nr:hypothetical protein [Bradyrhizobium sp. ARR65]
MTSESQLREKLRKIEALFGGAGTAGERLAAEAPLRRARARVEELARHDPPIEQQFSLPDQWSRHLFLALCRRYVNRRLHSMTQAFGIVNHLVRYYQEPKARPASFDGVCALFGFAVSAKSHGQRYEP